MMENSSIHYDGANEHPQRRSVEQNGRTQESLESERRANFAAMGMLAERTVIERTNPVEARNSEPKRVERLAVQVLGKEALSPEEESVPEIMYERRHEIKDEAATPKASTYLEPQYPQDNLTDYVEGVAPLGSVNPAAPDISDDQSGISPVTYTSAVRRGFYTGVAVVAISIMVYLIAQVIE